MSAIPSFETGNGALVPLCSLPAAPATSQQLGYEVGERGFSSPCASAGGGPVNQPPVVNAGPDQSVNLADGAQLAGQVADDGLPGYGALTYGWSQTTGPGVAAFGNAASLTSTVAFSVAGTYTLTLTATDGELAASSAVQISVKPLDPPLVPFPVFPNTYQFAYTGTNWRYGPPDGALQPFTATLTSDGTHPQFCPGEQSWNNNSGLASTGVDGVGTGVILSLSLVAAAAEDGTVTWNTSGGWAGPSDSDQEVQFTQLKAVNPSASPVGLYNDASISQQYTDPVTGQTYGYNGGTPATGTTQIS